MSTGTVVRKILNMPEPEAQTAPEGAEDEQPQEQAEDTGRAAASSSAHGWTIEEEHPMSKYGRGTARVLVFALVAVLVLVGLRTLINGPEAVEPVSDPTADFPTSQAQGVAARFTTNYLTSSEDEGGQQERAEGLSLDVAGGSSVDTEWTGEGATRVLSAYPAGITHEDDGRTAYVTVAAQVETTQTSEQDETDASESSEQSSSKEASKSAEQDGDAQESQPETSTRWVALSVPVQVVADRPVVAGTPAFVSLPRPGRAVEPPKDEPTDEATTRATEAGVEAFFKAYAGSDGAALEQATAPGSSLRPLGQAVEFSALRDWRVETGGADQRTGHATVTWRVGESTVEQNYRVTLASISSSTQESWRVSSVTAEIAE